jgi:hypothetical protein
MTKKPQPKAKHGWDDPEESERFLAEAKAAEASDDPKEFERALKAVSKPSRAGT